MRSYLKVENTIENANEQSEESLKDLSSPRNL